MVFIKRALFIAVTVLILSACSTNKFMVKASIPLLESGIIAMNHETDLELAKAAMPANIEMLESMVVMDPENLKLRAIGAQAYYGYAYAFVEDNNRQRASRFYVRGLKHGESALMNMGFDKPLTKMSYDDVIKQVEQLDESSVPLMFWTASCLAKWVDMNRDKPTIVAQISKAATLMERVLVLDEDYYHGSVHLFFGVYYGSRPPMLGGNIKKSQSHFDRVRTISKAQLLMADVLQAQYLERQRMNRTAFRTLLSRVAKLKDPLLPELSFINAISRQKAALMLKKEHEWF
jgi:hypothetical protein